ncbi:hypothetical protein [Pseudaestuariivita atlantica]|uniref:Uncharacterized protein n=1 Tax=Pseudaestuariivita atlantica TaxID=1317121 RepID=A0A0L1JQJ5_9RHOB|nr:hypothetical protein [Pseudaestuariivita atlantica]KNG94005.1 hypothetical protein ATO11_07015 [Pseudaestuariivita atlantica]
MSREWIGARRIAFIPVWNNAVDPRPSDDWPAMLADRVYFHPDPATGLDGSISAFIRNASSGRAWIDPVIMPVVEADDADVTGAGLASLPAGHDFDFAVIVIPHSVGPHRGGYFWSVPNHPSGVDAFCRIPMFRDTGLTMDTSVGVWGMEILHAVTLFGDLYFVSPAMDGFDVMSAASGPHPSAHTKSHFGWLSDGAIRDHALGLRRGYDLHAISLQRPLPPDRRRAIRIPSRTAPGHYMVEARLETDQFDGPSFVSSGIPSEGVIVYEVRDVTEVYLRTPTALGVGDRLELGDEDLVIRVQSAIPGGFNVGINSDGPSECEQLWNQIKGLETSIQLEQDFVRRKQMISALQKAKARSRFLHCNFLINPPEVAVADRVFGAPYRRDEPVVARKQGKDDKTAY